MPDPTILTPGVLEAGLMSVVSCPTCAGNLRAAFNRTDVWGGPPWKPIPCETHPNANWGTRA